jgi:hypothetical protein
METNTGENMRSTEACMKNYETPRWTFKGSGVECSSSGNGSWRISIAKIRYQETSSENTAEE